MAAVNGHVARILRHIAGWRHINRPSISAAARCGKSRRKVSVFWGLRLRTPPFLNNTLTLAQFSRNDYFEDCPLRERVPIGFNLLTSGGFIQCCEKPCRTGALRVKHVVIVGAVLLG